MIISIVEQRRNHRGPRRLDVQFLLSVSCTVFLAFLFVVGCANAATTTPPFANHVIGVVKFTPAIRTPTIISPSEFEQPDWTLVIDFTDTNTSDTGVLSNSLNLQFETASPLPDFGFPGKYPSDPNQPCSIAKRVAGIPSPVQMPLTQAGTVFTAAQNKLAELQILTCSFLFAPFQTGIVFKARQLTAGTADPLTATPDQADVNDKVYYSGFTPHPMTAKHAPPVYSTNWAFSRDPWSASGRFNITELNQRDLTNTILIVLTKWPITVESVFSFTAPSLGTPTPTATITPFPTSTAAQTIYMASAPADFYYQIIQFSATPKAISSIELHLSWATETPNRVDADSPIYMAMFGRDHAYIPGTNTPRINPLQLDKPHWLAMYPTPDLKQRPSSTSPLLQTMTTTENRGIIKPPQFFALSVTMPYTLKPGETISLMPKYREVLKHLVIPVGVITGSVNNFAGAQLSRALPYPFTTAAVSEMTLRHFIYVSPLVAAVPFSQRDSLFSFQHIQSGLMIQMPDATHVLPAGHKVDLTLGPTFFGTRTFTWDNQSVTGSLYQAALRIPGYIPGDAVFTFKLPVGTYMGSMKQVGFTMPLTYELHTPDLTNLDPVSITKYTSTTTGSANVMPQIGADCPTTADPARKCNIYTLSFTWAGITVGVSMPFQIFRSSNAPTASLSTSFDASTQLFDDNVSYTTSSLTGFVELTATVKNMYRAQPSQTMQSDYLNYGEESLPNDLTRTLQLGTVAINPPIPFVFKQRSVGIYSSTTLKMTGAGFGAYVAQSSTTSLPNDSFFRSTLDTISYTPQPPQYGTLDGTTAQFYMVCRASTDLKFVRAENQFLATGGITIDSRKDPTPDEMNMYWWSTGATIPMDPTKVVANSFVAVMKPTAPTSVATGFSTSTLTCSTSAWANDYASASNPLPLNTLPLEYTTPYIYYNPSITVTIQGTSTTIPLVNTATSSQPTLTFDSATSFTFVANHAAAVGAIAIDIKDSISQRVLQTYNIAASSDLTSTQTFAFGDAAVSNNAYMEIRVNHAAFATNKLAAVLITGNFAVTSSNSASISPLPLDAGAEFTLTWKSGSSGTVKISYFASPTAKIADGNTVAYVIDSSRTTTVGTNTATFTLSKFVTATQTAFIRIETTSGTPVDTASFVVYTYAWTMYALESDCNITARVCGTYTIPAARSDCNRFDGVNTVAADATKCPTSKPTKTYACTMPDCDNGGICRSDTSSVAPNTCDCVQPYSGTLCADYTSGCDFCSKENSTCVDVDPYECVCTNDFAGPACDKKACFDCVAANTEQCGAPTSTRLYGVCMCKPDFSGDSCQDSVVTDPCDSCIDDDDNTKSCEEGQCVCNPGFKGEFCGETATDVKPCAQCLSENLFECDETTGDNGTCVCKPGWTGTCRTPSTACSQCTQENLTRCDETGTEPVCICNEGWEGDLCEKPNGAAHMGMMMMVGITLIALFF